MEFLEELNTEQNYDLMTVKLTQTDRVENVSSMFPGYNTRVLLSSFMLKNFREILEISDELFEISTEMCRYLLEQNVSNIDRIYENFFNIFNAWRNDDIFKLKNDIEIHRIIYDSMIDENIQSEADQQWYDGVTQSIKIMERHIDKLDSMAHTPPKK